MDFVSMEQSGMAEANLYNSFHTCYAIVARRVRGHVLRALGYDFYLLFIFPIPSAQGIITPKMIVIIIIISVCVPAAFENK